MLGDIDLEPQLNIKAHIEARQFTNCNIDAVWGTWSGLRTGRLVAVLALHDTEAQSRETDKFHAQLTVRFWSRCPCPGTTGTRAQSGHVGCTFMGLKVVAHLRSSRDLVLAGGSPISWLMQN